MSIVVRIERRWHNYAFVRHIYGRNCVLHYFCADRRRNIQIIPTKAKWPLGKEKPLVVKTMQVTVSLADARNLYGAESRTRTDDLLITNQLLYQLSYFGPPLRLYRCARLR